MSSQINEELILLLMSMYGGLVLIVCYDSIRILRRIFKASTLRVIIEDVIFWAVASIFMFDILLKYNYGRPRYFAIGAALGVMALFEWFIGRHLIDKLSVSLKKIMNTLLKPLKKTVKMIKLKYSKATIKVRKKVKKCPNKEEHRQGSRREQKQDRRGRKGNRQGHRQDQKDKPLPHRLQNDQGQQQQAD